MRNLKMKAVYHFPVLILTKVSLLFSGRGKANRANTLTTFYRTIFVPCFQRSTVAIMKKEYLENNVVNLNLN